MRTILAFAALAILAPAGLAVPAVYAQAAADSAAIRATALDYIEGWYDGDAERMGRSLHPELVKRIVMINPDTGEPFIDTMGAGKLIEGSRAAYGRQTPEDQRRTDVTILDIFGNAASVKVDAGGWIDYMHVAKMNDRWTIVNVLWEMRH
ncbi:MAG: nuclear transport factor 2 family protein [Gemmatimonadota bacterium]